MTKHEQFKSILGREIMKALAEAAMNYDADSPIVKVLHKERVDIAREIAWHLSETYRFMEFVDLFEWKRIRVRR